MGGVGVHSHSCPSRGRLAATGYRREADQMFRMLYEIALTESRGSQVLRRPMRRARDVAAWTTEWMMCARLSPNT